MAIFRALLLHSILYYCIRTFAITVIPFAPGLPKPYESDVQPATSDYDLLLKINPSINQPQSDGTRGIFVPGSVYSMSGGINATSGIYAAQDSVVRGAIDASAKHQHLQLRPDDVWITILTQLGFYMRKRKDDKLVQNMWNNFDGQVPPTSIDWSWYLHRINEWVEFQFTRRSKVDWLKDWVQPNFTSLPNRSMGTEAAGEKMMPNTVFMASSTPSFEHIAPFACLNGIPSITLLGSQIDWIKLADKLTQMEKGAFGNEPTLYGRNLRPLLEKFIATFNSSNDPGIRLFWNGK
jgi:hypothetical protein